MSTLTLTEGLCFNSRYRVVRCIAMGGMGAVYEVVHIETERRRALKVMLPHLLQSDELRNRFRQEARVAAHIESEHIVDVFDAGIDETTQMPFLVMELLRGEELGKLLARCGRFSPADVITYLYQTSLALDKTHRAHIVHRDLKPENLFLTQREDGAPRVKVLDFGIAKLVADNATHANATRSLGTPLYMAPEQFRQGQAVSSATDMYSLGMIAFTFLVGSIYWLEESRGDGNVFAFANLVMNGPQEPATIRAQRRGVMLPSAFDAWFVKATALYPKDRFPTASSAVLHLADALGVPRPGLESSSVNATAVLQTPVGGMPTSGVAPSGIMDGGRTDSGVQGGRTTGSLSRTPQGIAAVTSGPAPKRIAPIAVAVGIAVGVLGLGVMGFLLIARGRTAAMAAAPLNHELASEVPPASPPPPITTVVAPQIVPVADPTHPPPSSTAAATPTSAAATGRLAEGLPPSVPAPVKGATPPVPATSGARKASPVKPSGKIEYVRD